MERRAGMVHAVASLVTVFDELAKELLPRSFTFSA